MATPQRTSRISVTFAGLGMAAAAVASASPVSAHHSFAMFDFSTNIDLVGTIEEFRWVNPHIQILVSAPDAQGRMQTWDIEGSTPNSLRPRGWTRETLRRGEKVKLVIHPLKNGSAGGSLVDAYREDGTIIGPRPAVAPAR